MRKIFVLIIILLFTTADGNCQEIGKSELPENLSFLSDVKEFQEFRLRMTVPELKTIIIKYRLNIRGEDEKGGVIVMNQDGETLALSISEGKCSGIQRLEKTPKVFLDVKKILENKDRRDWSKTPAQEHAEDLKYLGEEVMPILVTFLTDYNLGYDASETMLVIDEKTAAPLIFASMPKSNRNVQYHTFKRFIQNIQNHKSFEFKKEMHDAAVRCLESDTNADVKEQALLAVGLTGSDKDFPLLEKYYQENNRHFDYAPDQRWADTLRNASQAALARLGNEKQIAQIKDELRTHVPFNPSIEQALAASGSIEKAAFTGNKEFIPLLCKHLDDPGYMASDYGVSPAQKAIEALIQIVNNVSPYDKTVPLSQRDPKYWKERCQEFLMD